MDEYYEKNKGKIKKEMCGYLELISKELKEDTGKSFDMLIEEIWSVYKSDFLERFPFIGGDKASGTRNLTGAYSFVAMGEVCRKNYGMTLERWGYLTTLCYKRYFSKIPSFLTKIAGWALTKPNLLYKMLRKKDEKNITNARMNPGSFETETQNPTKEYPAGYNVLVCPLAEFAKKYGYMEYMPYICNLDYVMFEAFNVPFYRECTRADGDEFCDFKLKSGAPVNKSWPCHILTEGDPLK